MANTAGAIRGALLTPFVLLPFPGMRGAALAASAVNLAAAICALGLNRTVQTHSLAHRTPEPIRPASEARVALVLYALAGGIALCYEVVWSQAIVQFMSTLSFAVSVILATYLAGLLYAQRGDGVPEDRLGRRGSAGGCAVVLSHGVTLLIFTTGG